MRVCRISTVASARAVINRIEGGIDLLLWNSQCFFCFVLLNSSLTVDKVLVVVSHKHEGCNTTCSDAPGEHAEKNVVSSVRADLLISNTSKKRSFRTRHTLFSCVSLNTLHYKCFLHAI